MKIAIGSDHGGLELKKAIIAKYKDAEFLDLGPETADPCDYPDYADAVAETVALGEADFGVLVCTTGMGVSMAANKFQGVRAALCRDEKDATLARAHNGANVLCLGQDRTKPAAAVKILAAFISTAVDKASRHARRRAKLERAMRLSDFSLLAQADPEVYAAVKAQAEALGAVGAFKTDAGEWKALVFAGKMPFDPKGTYLIFR